MAQGAIYAFKIQSILTMSINNISMEFIPIWQ